MTSLEVIPKEPSGQALRLWRAVLSLAEPPNPMEPGPAAPSIPGLAENLVFEFDEAYTAFVAGFETLPSEEQMLALQAIDTKLASMIAARDAALWTERARSQHPVWDEARSLANRVLEAFAWPTNQA